MKGRPIRYSAAELAFIQSHCKMPRREMVAAFAAKFGRQDVTIKGINSVCKRKGWITDRRRWSAEDDAVLRATYADTSTEELARRLGRSLLATYNRAKGLELRKSDAYMASPAACRLRRGDNVGAAYRFPKGHAPANKGLRRPGWTAGRMQETQFVKGQAGWNWKPVGSERVVDGYSYTKVTDIRRVPWTVNWKPTHVLRWEEQHGPIAPGYALKCRDANRLNTDPSNWEAIPRAILPRLNKYHRYDQAPAELKPTIMAIARLQHTARKRA